MRKFGYASEGKSSAGVQTKESGASKGLRAALSMAGVNLYPISLTAVQTAIKNNQLKP
jgi:hypothetical protein